MGEARGLIRPHRSKLIFIVRALDALLIALVLYAVAAALDVPWEAQYTVAAAVAPMLFYVLASGVGLYGGWRGVPMRQEMLRIWTAWALVIPALLFGAFVSKTSATYSRAAMLAWLLAAPMAVTLFRATIRMTLQEIRQRGRNTRAVAIAGASQVGERVAREVVSAPWSGLRVLGFYDDRDHADPGLASAFYDHTPLPTRLHPIPADLGQLRGDFEQLVEDARAGRVDMVYIALPLRAEPRIRELIIRLADTTASVHVVADLLIAGLCQSRLSSVGDIPILSVFETPFHGVDGWLKRMEDILIGALILGIISIPMALIAAGVRLTSRGPIFFRQRRYGLNGEEFTVLKFRTMSVCEDGNRVVQATKNDPRVTPFGAFLRRTSLDELPQFLQVITGKMSIVGPRPHAVAHNELYRRKIQGYMLRHKVKPGITGWAQVNGWRGETDTIEKMERRIEHDLAYIRNWGLLLDLKIIALTVLGSASRRNAY